MIVCVKCQREMRCEKTGVGVHFGQGHVYAGDRFKCPECGANIVRTTAEPHFDPELKYHKEYVHMPSPAMRRLKDLVEDGY